MEKMKNSNLLYKRYSNAYSVAKTIIVFGGSLKVIGIVVGILFLIIAIINIDKALTVMAGSIILALFFGLFFYALGVLICAMGEMNRAVLDTAINTSTLFSDEIKYRIIFSQNKLQETQNKSIEYECSECKQSVSADATVCPNCGTKL
jgi:hypothetical protein